MRVEPSELPTAITSHYGSIHKPLLYRLTDSTGAAIGAMSGHRSRATGTANDPTRTANDLRQRAAGMDPTRTHRRKKNTAALGSERGLQSPLLHGASV